MAMILKEGMGKGCSDHAEISLRRASDEGSRKPPRDGDTSKTLFKFH